MNVYSIIIHNGPKVRQPKCPSAGTSVPRILFSHQKGWHADTCYNMDEP